MLTPMAIGKMNRMSPTRSFGVRETERSKASAFGGAAVVGGTVDVAGRVWGGAAGGELNGTVELAVAVVVPEED
jgi:hypothetical protein